MAIKWSDGVYLEPDDFMSRWSSIYEKWVAVQRDEQDWRFKVKFVEGSWEITACRKSGGASAFEYRRDRWLQVWPGGT